MSEESFARAGSQRWLQVAIAQHPELLDGALHRSGAIDEGDLVVWKSPLLGDNFKEYRDEAALRCLGIADLPKRSLTDFWPKRGPVWDALGRSKGGRFLFVEAKAHVPEAASPRSRASEDSLAIIRRSLNEARMYYAPRATAEWSGSLYQYTNRLAFHYLLSHINGMPSRLVFLNFYNAVDVKGPESEAEWHGATRLIHALLGLPPDLTKYGVFHAYMDARRLRDSTS